MRVFVTGVTGSGKTTLAKQMAKEFELAYVNFDDDHGYSDVSQEHAESFLDSLPEECVVDAIPPDPRWNTFVEWARGRDVRIFCAFLSHDKWLARYLEREKSLKGPDREPPQHAWDRFWIETLPKYRLPMTFCLDGTEYDHYPTMMTVDLPGMIRARIDRDMEESGYDSRYQDIQEIGFTGYSNKGKGSVDTWEGIRGLVEWGGASVVDLGCFHGYMLFRAEEAGASQLFGMDRSDGALVTARAVSFLKQSEVLFKKWTSGETVPWCDVTLCLNALHHFSNRFAVYDSIRSDVTIFECDEKFHDEISDHWAEVDEFKSERPGRAIYRCRR